MKKILSVLMLFFCLSLLAHAASFDKKLLGVWKCTVKNKSGKISSQKFNFTPERLIIDDAGVLSYTIKKGKIFTKAGYGSSVYSYSFKKNELIMSLVDSETKERFSYSCKKQ